MSVNEEFRNLRVFCFFISVTAHPAIHSSILLSNWSKHETDRKRREEDKKKTSIEFKKTKAVGIRDARESNLSTSCFQGCVTNPKVWIQTTPSGLRFDASKIS